MSVHKGGLCPRASLSRGRGGSLSRGSPSGRLPLYGKEQAVRIILECILVSTMLAGTLIYILFVGGQLLKSLTQRLNKHRDTKPKLYNGLVSQYPQEVPGISDSQLTGFIWIENLGRRHVDFCISKIYSFCGQRTKKCNKIILQSGGTYRAYFLCKN